MKTTLPQNEAAQNTNKPIDGNTAVGPKNAEELFAWLGYNNKYRCKHDEEFAKCMDCSH
jgi:hypothetical protein